MEFKDRIKLLREQSNLSSTQLAIEFNKTESAIRAWELGRTKPDADTLIKLSDYFNCTVDFLLGATDFKNYDDWLENVQSTEKTVNFLDRLNQRDKQVLTTALNDFLDFLLNNSFYDIQNKNTYISSLSSFLFLYREMINRAKEVCVQLNGKEKEETEKLKISGNGLALISFLTFLDARDSFKRAVERVYEDLLEHIANESNDTWTKNYIKSIFLSDKKEREHIREIYSKINEFTEEQLKNSCVRGGEDNGKHNETNE